MVKGGGERWLRGGGERWSREVGRDGQGRWERWLREGGERWSREVTILYFDPWFNLEVHICQSGTKSAQQITMNTVRGTPKSAPIAANL